MKTILENLVTARKVISRIPPNRVDLAHFGRRERAQPECGTLHCALGWLARSSEFSDTLSLEWQEPNREPTSDRLTAEFARVVWKESTGAALSGVLPQTKDFDMLWGRNSFCRLFEMRGSGTIDEQIATPEELLDPELLSDQELALRRLDFQIRLYEGQTA